jgi:hypothetical protein
MPLKIIEEKTITSNENEIMEILLKLIIKEINLEKGYEFVKLKQE